MTGSEIWKKSGSSTAPAEIAETVSSRCLWGGKSFLVIASDGGGWDHVSVTTRNGNRCPTWEEMCAIKDMFFYPEECVVQYHPAKSEYVNIHEHCLHLWRPQRKSVPMPPIEFV